MKTKYYPVEDAVNNVSSKLKLGLKDAYDMDEEEFDNVEKHFEKKCRGWKEKIRELEEVNAQLHKKIYDNCVEFEKLQMENEYLKQQNEILMKVKDMSVDDIKVLIESEASFSRASWALEAMSQRMF